MAGLKQLIRIEQLRVKLGGVSVDTVYRLMRSAGFPRQVKLGRRIATWDAGEVEAWIERRAREQRSA